jgi:hypothetical protein
MTPDRERDAALYNLLNQGIGITDAEAQLVQIETADPNHWQNLSDQSDPVADYNLGGLAQTLAELPQADQQAAIDQHAMARGYEPADFRDLMARPEIGLSLNSLAQEMRKGSSWDDYQQSARNRGVVGLLDTENRSAARVAYRQIQTASDEERVELSQRLADATTSGYIEEDLTGTAAYALAEGLPREYAVTEARQRIIRSSEEDDFNVISQSGEFGFDRAEDFSKAFLENPEMVQLIEKWSPHANGAEGFLRQRLEQIEADTLEQGETYDTSEALTKAIREVAMLRTVGVWSGPAFLPVDMLEGTYDPQQGDVNFEADSSESDDWYQNLKSALKPRLEVIGVSNAGGTTGQGRVVVRMQGAPEWVLDLADAPQAIATSLLRPLWSDKERGEAVARMAEYRAESGNEDSGLVDAMAALRDEVVEGIGERANLFEEVMKTGYARENLDALATAEDMGEYLPAFAKTTVPVLGGFAAAVVFPDLFGGATWLAKGPAKLKLLRHTASGDVAMSESAALYIRALEDLEAGRHGDAIDNLNQANRVEGQIAGVGRASGKETGVLTEQLDTRQMELLDQLREEGVFTDVLTSKTNAGVLAEDEALEGLLGEAGRLQMGLSPGARRDFFRSDAAVDQLPTLQSHRYSESVAELNSLKEALSSNQPERLIDVMRGVQVRGRTQVARDQIRKALSKYSKELNPEALGNFRAELTRSLDRSGVAPSLLDDGGKWATNLEQSLETLLDVEGIKADDKAEILRDISEHITEIQSIGDSLGRRVADLPQRLSEIEDLKGAIDGAEEALKATIQMRVASLLTTRQQLRKQGGISARIISAAKGRTGKSPTKLQIRLESLNDVIEKVREGRQASAVSDAAERAIGAVRFLSPEARAAMNDLVKQMGMGKDEAFTVAKHYDDEARRVAARNNSTMSEWWYSRGPQIVKDQPEVVKAKPTTVEPEALPPKLKESFDKAEQRLEDKELAAEIVFVGRQGKKPLFGVKPAKADEVVGAADDLLDTPEKAVEEFIKQDKAVTKADQAVDEVIDEAKKTDAPEAVTEPSAPEPAFTELGIGVPRSLQDPSPNINPLDDFLGEPAPTVRPAADAQPAPEAPRPIEQPETPAPTPAPTKPIEELDLDGIPPQKQLDTSNRLPSSTQKATGDAFSGAQERMPGATSTLDPRKLWNKLALEKSKEVRISRVVRTLKDYGASPITRWLMQSIDTAAGGNLVYKSGRFFVRSGGARQSFWGGSDVSQGLRQFVYREYASDTFNLTKTLKKKQQKDLRANLEKLRGLDSANVDTSINRIVEGLDGADVTGDALFDLMWRLFTIANRPEDSAARQIARDIVPHRKPPKDIDDAADADKLALDADVAEMATANKIPWHPVKLSKGKPPREAVVGGTDVAANQVMVTGHSATKKGAHGFNEPTIVHEILHNTTAHLLRDKGFKAERDALNSVRETVLSKIDTFKVSDIDPNLLEGVVDGGRVQFRLRGRGADIKTDLENFKRAIANPNTGVDELISYTFTNPTVQQVLKNIPVTDKTVVGLIKNAFDAVVLRVLKVLKIEPTQDSLDAVSAVFELTDRIIQRGGKVERAKVPKDILPATAPALRKRRANISELTEFTEDGRTIFKVMEGFEQKFNVNEMLTGLGYIARRDLTPTQSKQLAAWLSDRVANTIEVKNGRFVGDAESVRLSEKLFAETFAKFLQDNKTSSSWLAQTLQTVKNGFGRIFKGTKYDAQNLKMPSKAARVFEKLTEDPTARRSPSYDYFSGLTGRFARSLTGRFTQDPQIQKNSASAFILREANRTGLQVRVLNADGKPTEILTDLGKIADVFKSEQVLGLTKPGTDELVTLPKSKISDALEGSPTQIGWQQGQKLSAALTDNVAREAKKKGSVVTRRRQFNDSDDIVDEIRVSLAGEGKARWLAKGVLSTFVGGDPHNTLGLADLPPIARNAVLAGTRLIEQAYGEVTRLLLDQEWDKTYQFLAGDTIALKGGRQAVSSGYNVMGDIQDGLRHYFDANPRFVVAWQEVMKSGESLIDVEKANRALSTITTSGKQMPDFLKRFIKSLRVNEKLNDNAVQVLNALFEELDIINVKESVNPRVFRVGENPALFDDVSEVAARTKKLFDRVGDIAGEKGPEIQSRMAVLFAGYGNMQRTVQTWSGLGILANKTKEAAFSKYLNGSPLTRTERQDAAQMSNIFGMNKDFVDAEGLFAGHKGAMIPQAAQEKLFEALKRGEARDPGGNTTKWLEKTTEDLGPMGSMFVRYMKKRMTRGNYILRQRYFLMNTIDHLFMLAGTPGVSFGSAMASTARLSLQNVMVLPGMGIVSLLSKNPEKIREGLQKHGDKVAQFLSGSKWRVEVNDVLKGGDKPITIAGNVYSYKQIRQIAIEEGIFASFDTSELSRAIGSQLDEYKDLFVSSANSRIAGAPANVVSGLKRAKNAGVNAHRELSQNIDDIAEAWGERERLGAMVTLMEQGVPARRAARLTIDALFDYAGSMSKGDRHFLVSLFLPFWAFQKNANQQFIRRAFSVEGAYKMGVLRRSMEYGTEGVEQVLFSSVFDAYGVDVGSLPPEEREKYMYFRKTVEYGHGPIRSPRMPKPVRDSLLNSMGVSSLDELDEIMAEVNPTTGESTERATELAAKLSYIENGYDGIANVPPNVLRGIRMMLTRGPGVQTGNYAGFEEGEAYMAGPASTLISGALNDIVVSGTGGLSSFVGPTIDDAGRAGFRRHRYGIAIPQRMTDSFRAHLRVSSALNGGEVPYSEFLIPESTMYAGLNHIVYLASAYAGVGGSILGMVSDKEEVPLRVIMQNSFNEVVDVERAPIPSFIASTLGVGSEEGGMPRRLDPRLAEAWKTTHLPDLIETEQLSALYDVADAETQAELLADYSAMLDMPETDIAVLLQDKQNRYYIPGGHISFIADNFPMFGELNRRMLSTPLITPSENADPLEQTLGGWRHVLDAVRFATGVETAQVRRHKQARRDEYDLPDPDAY